MRSNVWRRAETSPGSTKCKKGGELYMARLYCRIVGPVLLVVGVLEAVMNSIRNGLGMRKAGTRRGPGQPANPHLNAVFTKVHNTL